MKCEVCKTKIQETFLKKVVGTVIKDEKGKNHFVCSNCQKLGKEELVKKF